MIMCLSLHLYFIVGIIKYLFIFIINTPNTISEIMIITVPIHYLFNSIDLFQNTIPPQNMFNHLQYVIINHTKLIKMFKQKK